MVFSSVPFLFYFLPIVLFLYWILRGNTARNILLLIVSLLFYAWGEPVYIILILLSVLCNWLISLAMTRFCQKDKFFLAIAVLVNIGLLVVFKYSSFLVETVNALLQLSLPVPQIRLPIGISFFTFQALSYVIDVYRDRKNVQKNFFGLLLYISFFPQLIAGPIVKYNDIRHQLSDRTFRLDDFVAGIKRFTYGLAKKVILSNSLAVLVDAVFSFAPSCFSASVAWVAALSYMLQIYYDFSGYSDMAIGLGQIFGFTFKENFRYPYASLGIKDFWRRWHISLSTWFKEYLYIPLGGNRKGKGRALCNQLIVFTATGLWHGANFTFLLCGLFHGLFLILESSLLIPVGKLCKKPGGKVLTRVYTWFVVLIGFVLFRADSVSYALSYLKTMFQGGGLSNGTLMSHMSPWFWFVFALSVVFSFPLTEKIRTTMQASQRGNQIYCAVSYGFSILLLLICMGALAAATYNPFIYFRF